LNGNDSSEHGSEILSLSTELSPDSKELAELLALFCFIQNNEDSP
jgi:hypothetical protein